MDSEFGLFHVLLCSALDGEERAGCFTLFIFLVSLTVMFCGSSSFSRGLVCHVFV